MAEWTESPESTVFQTALYLYLNVALQKVLGKDLPTTLSTKAAYKEEQPGWNTSIDNTTRQFIKLEQCFLRELSQHTEQFAHENSYILNEKMKLSSELLLQIKP